MNADQYYSNSIFWVEVDKIHPNPYQPRRDFDEAKLKDLGDSIRQYGVLQPLIVTRIELSKPDGGLSVEYELISGERRLRAAKMANVAQVPVLIRAASDDPRVKLELAIIENVQREDLNSVDRARAFDRLVKEFNFKHSQIAERIGKSREYVSNTIRLLMLPEEMLAALSRGAISEGHTRPLLMLIDRPVEQKILFKDIVMRRVNVRDAENMARRVAVERVRNKEKYIDPDLFALEKKLNERLGTRVYIERRDNGGKIHIDFFTFDDLRSLVNLLEGAASQAIAAVGTAGASIEEPALEEDGGSAEGGTESAQSPSAEDDLYSVKNFTI